MPRTRKPFPSYRYHKRSGQAVVTLIDPSGRRKDIYLGPYGSERSREEYARIIAQLKVTSSASSSLNSKTGITVSEIILAFLTHSETHYRHPDGTLSAEVDHYKYVLAFVKRLYGRIPASEFGPLALKAVRQQLVDQGLCRKNINTHVGRIKRMFKWATSEEIFPPSSFHALQTVAGLQRGRTTAPDYEPVRPVPLEHFSATLPKLTATLRSMVELQRYTGMRPGEVIVMRPREIDRSQDTWIYRPKQHKTSYRGVVRLVVLGPHAREILKSWLDRITDPDEYIFSPRRSRDERFAVMREQRITKVQPSQLSRRKPIVKLKKIVREKFTVSGYSSAVRDASTKAGFGWSPNQLRHTFATEVRKKFGLEAAQVLLGHSRADVTQVYAERNESLAFTVAEKVG